MTKQESEVLSGILGTVARKQKIANLILFLALVCTLIWIQTSIDAKNGFFLQGFGCIVYIFTGLIFIFIWTTVSHYKFEGNEYITLIENGKVVSDRNPVVLKLLNSYNAVTKKLNLNQSEYRLIIRLDGKDTNAFSFGLSRNKTVVVNSKTITECTDDELNAVTAHEFGHLVNKDIITATIRSSLSCFLNFIGVVGFIVAWIIWGFLSAVIYFSITAVLIPFLTNRSSRISEEFADLFATQYGYGEGLRSFLSKKTQYPKIIEMFLNHPVPQTRLEYILKFMTGDDGKVRDNTEHLLWTIAKIVLLGVGAVYLTLHGVPATDFLLAGAMFFLSDIYMSNNPGISHITRTSSMKLTGLKAWLPVIVSFVLVVGLYVAGIFAGINFLKSESSIISTFSLIALISWSVKPIAGAFQNSKSDLLAAISEISTYVAFVASIMMMASCFFAF